MTLQLVNKAPEVKLMQWLSEMHLQSTGWQGVHFNLADLLEEYKSEYQVKIAINLINDLLKSEEGILLEMPNRSLILLGYRLEMSILEKLIFQLRYLFMDDPLAYTDTGQENPNFCVMYDLKRDWHPFYDLASQYMATFTRHQPVALQQTPEKSKSYERIEPMLPVIEPRGIAVGDGRIETRGAMSASKLAHIEHTLRSANLNNAIRRQPVCAVLTDKKVRRVFDELYINIAHLRRILKSEVDFLSNRWLFKYITQILDQRMIEHLRGSYHRYLDSPVSINLNVETILSQWFTDFDETIPSATKVSIVLEVPVVDVFADMTAFIMARDEVQKLGYRVCLDGLTTASFASINREKLGLDLVKVQWNADSSTDLKSAENETLYEAVQATGTNRVILCRCDNSNAISYGQAFGISLFQGRYLDNILNPSSKVEN